ncbi:hypothetical protein RRG08_016913 [Elysia crispata]|uniref:Peptidase M12B domain-containing protein n=1 Tax=Elysia crispata TaxID=231223 RepID=A0AAE1DI26_9GAST|nr:hypothetical protein RRG08_016913 [Elysia crispata]
MFSGKPALSMQLVGFTLFILLTSKHVTDAQSRFQPGSLGAIPEGLGSVGGLQPIARQGSVGGLQPTARQGSYGGLQPRAREGSVGGLQPTAQQGSVGGLQPRARQGSVEGLQPRARQGSVGGLQPTARQGSYGGLQPRAREGSVGGLQPIAPLDPFSSSGNALGVLPGSAGLGGQVVGPSAQRLGGNARGGLRSRGQVLAPVPPQMSVELLLLVDKMAKDRWASKMPGATPKAREENALTAMEQFLESVVHGVNELYASLGKYNLFVDVRIVAIRQINNLWAGTAKSAGAPNQIAANQAIDTFYDWSWRNRRSLPGFDHALLLTGFDVVDHTNASKPTTGVAYKGVMCKFGSISVIENSFTFQMVHDIAHELGHSLGCDHDGERNTCDGSDGFIMSVRPDVNSTNRWDFSPCSADSIREDIALLERDNANCLRKTTAEKTVAPQLGTVLNADKQCKFLFGQEAYFCRDFYNTSSDYHQLCSSLWCSESLNATQCVSHIASDGFLCGDSMICSRGQCIKVEGAPMALDSCPQGDQPGIVLDGMTCEDIVRLTPWACYDDFYRRKCCIACPGISKRSAAPDCPYGDREAWCQTDKMKYPYDCYLNNATCCQTCAQLQDDSKPGCEYGDHSAECVTDLDLPLGCYWNEELCCSTCAQYKNMSNVDCEYGDKSTWCKNQLEVPNGCYLNKDLCCGTCQEHINLENKACPYGDRYPKWCPTVTPYRCYNETVRDWCCDSCSQLYNTSNDGCEYGDKFKNCEDLIYPYACYHPTNQDACCGFCSIYANIIEGSDDSCIFGDKQAWCWKLTLTYDDSEWCPLDAENDHCCGTCRYNSSAVPVFGYRLLEEGLEQVTLLGNQFKTEVKAVIEERKKEEKALRQKEEEERRKKQVEEEREGQAQEEGTAREEEKETLRLGESKEPESTSKPSSENDEVEIVDMSSTEIYTEQTTPSSPAQEV